MTANLIPEAVERLRLALKVHDGGRTTLQSLASSVGDFLRDYNAAQQQGQAAPVAPVGVDELVREYRPSMDAEVLHAWAKDVVGALAQQPAGVVDTQRMDWLEQHDARFYNIDRIAAIVGKGFLVGGTEQGHFKTLREAIDASLSAPQPPAKPTNRAESSSKLVDAQPVGEVGSLPGSNGGFTTAVFKASDVPVGTKLYTAPPSTSVGVEGLAKRIETYHWDAADKSVAAKFAAELRSLAQQHAACVGCEGNPAPENSPCAVCGQQPAADRLPPRKNEREADGKFRTVYLFDTPREQGRFQQQVEAFYQQSAADCPDCLNDGCFCPSCNPEQPASAGEMAELVGLLDEVRSHFTRDDDLPDDLLPRIDAALAAKPRGSNNE